MSLFNINREELQKVIAQLEQAMYNHQQWYKALNRSLICRLPSDRHNLSPEAHKECLFGQWYSTYAHPALLEHPGFIVLGEAHKQMHVLASRISIAADSGSPVPTNDYDNFLSILERLQLELSTLKRELEDLLYSRDPLTGAITRVNMLPILREQQAFVKRKILPYCLVMMDLDFFKKVNDLHGHVAGDQVLAASSHFMAEHLRPFDKLFRYGGEEFLFCIQAELPESQELVERLRAGLESMPINIGQNEPIHITGSFGLTALDAAVSVEESIAHADKALYAAKSSGRNCIKIWEPTM
ncbi:MAG: diguanylate cyclase [Gammaproteobacteria bacterium]|nr:diguanylate cyclase [Gammaproteobacteria bacterium]